VSPVTIEPLEVNAMSVAKALTGNDKNMTAIPNNFFIFNLLKSQKCHTKFLRFHDFDPIVNKTQNKVKKNSKYFLLFLSPIDI
jgi:hypothetical protein